jgi:23S rRNA (cytidine1920-2'-O)/16S rRNA (cytidine1409-2'-O)-methyltransferase
LKKERLDSLLIKKGLAKSRRQAVGLIMAGDVSINGVRVDKAGMFVKPDSEIQIKKRMLYVSRGALKLESALPVLDLDFKDKIILDVGASTGGFTDFALQQGAKSVYAVDVGTNQLDHKLRVDPRVIVMEKTDIRDVMLASGSTNQESGPRAINKVPNVVLIDVSFISLRLILPAVVKLCSRKTQIVAMVKPQFEAGIKEASKNKGVIKNDTLRRAILKDFEQWVKQQFVIKAKADSAIKGAKGNLERFYLLQKL